MLRLHEHLGDIESTYSIRTGHDADELSGGQIEGRPFEAVVAKDDRVIGEHVNASIDLELTSIDCCNGSPDLELALLSAAQLHIECFQFTGFEQLTRNERCLPRLYVSNRYGQIIGVKQIRAFVRYKSCVPA